MSIDSESERENANAHAVNAPNAPGATTPESEVNPAVANFRQGFFTESRYGLLLALGEEPQEYQRVMESLLEDLQPGRGLETHLVEQMGETFWRIRRAQRIRDGLALKSIQRKVQGEAMAKNGGLQPTPAVAPHQCLREGQARGTREKDVKKIRANPECV